MADKKENEQQKQNKDSAFIREKIAKKPLTKKQKLCKVFTLVACAVAFGFISCATFVLCKPLLESALRQEPSASTIVIPRDEDYTQMETETQTESAKETQTEQTEPIDEIIQNAINENPLDLSDYKTFYALSSGIAKDAGPGLVTVNSLKQDVDWFDNVYQSEGRASGAIVEITDSQLLILTRYDILEDMDELQVTFMDESKALASIKGVDKTTGIAIISVLKADVRETTLEKIKSLELGNSYLMSLGNPVIAVGNPYGNVGSIAMGSIVYVAADVQGIDTTLRVLYTDMSLAQNAGGFLLNVEGEIIGMFVKDLRKDEDTMTPVAAISSLKWMIEQLCNGRAIPYLGIRGQAVTPDIAQQHNLPGGLYITEAAQGGPAYKSGIQRGDILVEVNDKTITNMKDLQDALLSMDVEDKITVKVKRSSKDSFKDVTFQLTLQER